MHHHTELSFVDEFRWVSPFRYLKNGWHNAVLLWCMLLAGPPSLHYYCDVVLHSCTVLSPVSHSSNHQYHRCQLKRQSSCVSNFYRTFQVFLRLSLVCLTLCVTWRHLVLIHKKSKVQPTNFHEGLDGEQKYSSTLSLISALDGGEWSTPRPHHFNPREKTR